MVAKGCIYRMISLLAAWATTAHCSFMGSHFAHHKVYLIAAEDRRRTGLERAGSGIR